MKLTDHVVLITGGGSGIGLAIARTFVSIRNRVVICGNNIAQLQDAQITTPELHGIQCDITNADNVQQMLDEIDRHYGRLTILVNNVGVQHNYLLQDIHDVRDKIYHEIEVNFGAMVCLTYQCLPLLLQAGETAIINVGSRAGLIPKLDSIVYSATKAAVHSFTTGLRWQLEPTSVRVFELFPPMVETPMIETEVVAEALVRGIARNRSEIFVDRMRVLRLLVRFAPQFATKSLKKG